MKRPVGTPRAALVAAKDVVNRIPRKKLGIEIILGLKLGYVIPAVFLEVVMPARDSPKILVHCCDHNVFVVAGVSRNRHSVIRFVALDADCALVYKVIPQRGVVKRLM